MVNAGPVPNALKQEVVARLGEGFLYEIDGSTELGIATVLRPEDQLRKPGSCGRAYGSVELRVVDDDGVDAPAGAPGELFIRSPNAMEGYHGSTEQLAALPGGWKSVGDVGWLDGEGYLHICDRRTDMVITGGMNVYPAEVEAALHAHGDVADAAVFGVADDEWGERVHAVVAARAGRTSTRPRWTRSWPSGWRGSSDRGRGRSATSCRAPRAARCSSGCCARAEHDAAGEPAST